MQNHSVITQQEIADLVTLQNLFYEELERLDQRINSSGAKLEPGPWSLNDISISQPPDTHANAEDPSTDLVAVKALVRILRTDRGSSTPIEEFVLSILRDYADNVPLDPKRVKQSVHEFEAQYNHVIECAHIIMKRYPGAFRDPQPGKKTACDLASQK